MSDCCECITHTRVRIRIQVVTSFKVIQTEQGNLRFDSPDEELMRKLRRWPKGIHQVKHSDKELYAIIRKDKQGEESGLQFHFGYYKDPESAREIFHFDRLLLSKIVASFVTYDFDGILLPCAYLKTSESGSSYTGFILLGLCTSMPTVTLSESPTDIYDCLFGTGATEMMFRFIKTCVDASAWAGLPDRVVAELCPEHPSQLGSIALDFLIAGSDIVYLHEEISQDSRPFYEVLTEAGVRTVYHLPSVLAESQLEP